MSAVPGWMRDWGGCHDDVVDWNDAKKAARALGCSVRFRRGQGARNNKFKMGRIAHLEIVRGGEVIGKETLVGWWDEPVDSMRIMAGIVRLMERLDRIAEKAASASNKTDV